MQLFPEKLISLWNGWEVRSIVLLSLLLQVILIAFGARRKITARAWIRVLVWSAYMTADWVATVALGNLARSQLGDSENSSVGKYINLQAFWAPFLLLHLGGPDTITAYALEDNELWLRHLLGLLVQVGVASYVFIRSWSSDGLTFLSIPMFISGIIKYGERNFVLRSSSSHCLRDSLPLHPDECQQYVKLVERNMTGEISERSGGEISEGEISVASRGEISEESPGGSPQRLHEESKGFMVVVHDDIDKKDNYFVQAYFCFKRFIYHFANLELDDKEQKCIYSTIKDKNAVDAFKMVATELGFLYDVSYTKAAIFYSRLGIVLRCISFICSVSALVVFSIIIEVHAYSLIDISVTYILLAGAVFLEIYALLLLLFSDWTKLWLINPKKETSKTLLQNFLKLISDSAPLLSNRKRWSRSLGQYNLISSCLRKVQPTCIVIQKLPFVGESSDKYWHLTWEDVHVSNLPEAIFNFLKKFGDRVNESMDDKNLSYVVRYLIFGRRNNLALVKSFGEGEAQDVDDFISLCTSVIGFVDSIFVWHITTDLLYYDDLFDRWKGDNSKLDPNCNLSKYLSNYMFYLLVCCPFMLPQGSGARRYRGAYDEVIRLFKQRRPDEANESAVCKDLLGMYPEQTEDIDSDFVFNVARAEKHSLLKLGCMLFQKLKKIDGEINWKGVSNIWMDKLAYAAYNCEWTEHAQQLRKGGEFLTHVYLVMAHFGFSKLYGGHNFAQGISSMDSGDGLNDLLEGYFQEQREGEEERGHV